MPAMIQAARRRKRDGLRDKLQELILSGKLEGGARLNELQLSRRLAVSRTPLREALLHLEREGLVRSDLRRGFSVEPLSSREVRETYPVLAQLECLAVRSSAAFLPPLIPELARVNALLSVARTGARARDLDALWHKTLIGQTRNGRLIAMIGRLHRTVARYERLYMADRNHVETSVRQHAAILAALEAGKIEAALTALEENYLFGMQVLLRKMGEE
jgi:DNA-binding GntR family transcriptional regulator